MKLWTCETSNSHILLEQKCNEFFLFKKNHIKNTFILCYVTPRNDE